MRIKEARISGTFLMLDIEHEDMGEARRFVFGFQPGNYVVNKASRKRSLNANALCWKLCGEIGTAIGESAINVYRRAIKEGNVYARLSIPSAGVERFVKDWTSRGIGWVVQIVDSFSEMTELLAYYGSSTYTTKEMSDLIDRLLMDADALGLDCLSDYERALLEGGE